MSSLIFRFASREPEGIEELFRVFFRSPAPFSQTPRAGIARESLGLWSTAKGKRIREADGSLYQSFRARRIRWNQLSGSIER